MRMLRAAGRVVCVLLPLASFGAAVEIAVPALTARVTDQTGTLTAEQGKALERTLESFEAGKGSQIAVLIVSTTAPETIEEYSLRVAEQWQLGRKGIDDGALVLVAKADRAVRIEVGDGLEGALNDATANRIVEEIIIPRFRRGDFSGGITAGVDRMIKVIEGEPLPAPSVAPVQDTGIGRWLPLLLLVVFVGGGLLRSLLGRLTGGVVTGAVVSGLVWLLAGALLVAAFAGVLAFLFTAFGGGGRNGGWYGGPPGRYRAGRSGGFGGGFGRGGFGGGFRGGGGGFSGGGASGRW